MTTWLKIEAPSPMRDGNHCGGEDEIVDALRMSEFCDILRLRLINVESPRVLRFNEYRLAKENEERIRQTPYWGLPENDKVEYLAKCYQDHILYRHGWYGFAIGAEFDVSTQDGIDFVLKWAFSTPICEKQIELSFCEVYTRKDEKHQYLTDEGRYVHKVIVTVEEENLKRKVNHSGREIKRGPRCCKYVWRGINCASKWIQRSENDGYLYRRDRKCIPIGLCDYSIDGNVIKIGTAKFLVVERKAVISG